MDNPRSANSPGRVLGRLVGAALLVSTAAIHLDLYLTGYKSIPTVGRLFLLQVVTGFVLGVAVLAFDSRLVEAAGAGFALSTLGGYLLSLWIGLFGFKEVRTTAGVVAGLIEVAAFATLAFLAVLPSGRTEHARLGSDLPAAPGLKWSVAGVSLVALIVLGTTLATADGSENARSGGRSVLISRRIDHVNVLTNANGFTLYWFAPDTATSSHCNGTCTAYWPPVTGAPILAPGVIGTPGTVKRGDGVAQATYDGHPLYTYIGDTAPGQASGNGIDLNGGLWHEVTVAQ
jgi:predicted lipoprotein with Yx(FWY)xxD motif